ncbi:MAG TPA: heme ABC exporter ATP-binding protein CcmA [Vicinamibacterales bacterium]|nr:heme ABC exporter ATP-binding protein CcmA [Vicinamibacterales bacterium]
MSPPPAPPTSTFDFPFVAVDDVSRVFGRRRALSHVSVRIEAGQIVGALGPNGAGKSTLLGILATLLRPTAGAVRYGTLTSTQGAALRARIGVLGHDLFLYPELTARENLEFFAGVHGLDDPAAAAREALARAGLDDRGDDPVSAFSRGMRQRVALERALIHRPRLVLLDEPFTGLDDASAAALLQRLHALRADGAMVVVATHDLDLADGLLDHALFLRDGRPAASVARPERLRSTYRDVMARPLTGGGA